MRPFALLSVLALAACSAGTSDDPPTPFTGPITSTSISLRNDAEVPIAYIAVGEGSLALINVPATLLPHQYDAWLVKPGQTVPVPDVLGYMEGLGVNFLVYLVDPFSGEARYRVTFLASAAELARSGGLVTFSNRFRPPQKF